MNVEERTGSARVILCAQIQTGTGHAAHRNLPDRVIPLVRSCQSDLKQRFTQQHQHQLQGKEQAFASAREANFARTATITRQGC